MFQISLFPSYAPHLPPTTSILFKVEIITSERWCVWRHFCLPLKSMYGNLFENKMKEPTSNGECCPYRIVCCNPSESDQLIFLRGSVAELSKKNYLEFGRKFLIIVGLITHLQSRDLHSAGTWMGLISDEWANSRWGPLHPSCSYPLNKTILQRKSCYILTQKPQKVSDDCNTSWC